MGQEGERALADAAIAGIALNRTGLVDEPIPRDLTVIADVFQRE
jgi:hypothetical protein